MVLLVILDMKKAFNSASWTDILHSFSTIFTVPQDLILMTEDYLKVCRLHYKIPKDIIIGIMYDALLKLDLRFGVILFKRCSRPDLSTERGGVRTVNVSSNEKGIEMVDNTIALL